MVVSAKLDVETITITKLQGLVFAGRDGYRSPDTRVSLLRERVFHTVQTCFPADPIVAVEGDPKPRLEVVADMSFKGADMPDCALICATMRK